MTMAIVLVLAAVALLGAGFCLDALLPFVVGALALLGAGFYLGAWFIHAALQPTRQITAPLWCVDDEAEDYR